jgi:hypothetical protein
MPTRPHRTQLGALLAARGWSGPHFVREFTGTAREMKLRDATVSLRTARHWIAGDVEEPIPAASRVLEKIFGVPVAELLAPPPPALIGQQPHGRAVRVAAPAHLQASDSDGALTGTGLASWQWPDDHGPISPRPTQVGLAPSGDDPSGAPTLEGLMTMSTSRVKRLLPLLEGSNVGPDTINSIRDEVERLARAFNDRPVTAIFPDLLEVQDYTLRLLEGRQRAFQTRDLNFLASVACGLTATAYMDFGNTQAAKLHARMAYVCAENAGHPSLMTWVRVTQAMNAYWGNQAAEAVRYCEMASGIDDAASAGTVSTWLPALKARAHASSGDAEAARSCIADASRARDALARDDLDEIGGQLTFTLPRQLYYAADTLSWIPGDSGERAALDAVNAFEHAAPDERSYGNEALSRACLGLARAESGDPDGSVEALRPVLDLEPALRIDAVRTTVARIKSALSRPALTGSTTARTLRLEVERFAHTPAALPS